MTTISFSHWGRHDFAMPSRVRQPSDGFTTPIEAVCRAIGRKNRGLVVANCRRDLSEVDRHGRTISQHYELTLGRPCKGGGYNVHGSVWLAIKH
jgi:hypothetical protein